jgi:hypothetical protein
MIRSANQWSTSHTTGVIALVCNAPEAETFSIQRK